MKYQGVAVSGKAGAGKTQFAHELERRFAAQGIWTGQLAFGDAVKEETLRLFGLRKGDPGSREAMVEVGHGQRAVCPDYWVRKLAKKYDSLTAYGLTPIVTDVRYTNEYEWAKQAGLLLVRVDALPMDRMVILSHRGEDVAFAHTDHPSECDLDEQEFDYRFWNAHGDTFRSICHAASTVVMMMEGTEAAAA